MIHCGGGSIVLYREVFVETSEIGINAVDEIVETAVGKTTTFSTESSKMKLNPFLQKREDELIHCLYY